MKVCAACGAPVGRGQFCGECGAPLEGLTADTTDLPPLPVITSSYARVPAVRPQRSVGPWGALLAAVLAATAGAGAVIWAVNSDPDVASSSGSERSGPPTTAAGIDFTSVAGNRDLAAIATVLDTYFTGVNTHNARQAISVFSPRSKNDPNDPDSIKRLAAGIRSTIDDDIQVVSIYSSNFTASDGTSLPTTAVDIRFRSRQDAADGDHGQTCSDWRLIYHLVDVPSWTASAGPTHYQVLGTIGGAPTPC